MMRFRLSISTRIALGVTTVSLIACDVATSPAAPTPSVSSRSVKGDSSAPELDASLDGSFAKVGAVANSFAGAWIDEDGLLVIALASMADSTRARDAFLEERSRAYRVSEKVAAVEAAQLRAPWSRVKFVRVAYAFSDLQRWKIAMAPALILTEGVSSIDVDEMRNAITVGISSAQSADAVLRIGRDAGAPSGALRVIEEGAAVEARQSADLGARQRPLTGGFVLGPSACTMTGSAYRVFEPLVVTAAHCTATKFSLDGQSISQGNGTDTWGFEVIDPNRYACGTFFNWKSCRRADVAAYNVSAVTQWPTDTLAFHVGLIARTTFPSSGLSQAAGSLAIDQTSPYWYIDAEAQSVLVDTGVHKVGRTTGWTYGAVTQTCVDRQSKLSTWIVCSDNTNLFGQGGDSGSPVFIVNNSVSVTFVGTLFAVVPGSPTAVMSNLGQMKQDLGNVRFF